VPGTGIGVGNGVVGFVGVGVGGRVVGLKVTLPAFGCAVVGFDVGCGVLMGLTFVGNEVGF
jgi:hypothetical protein